MLKILGVFALIAFILLILKSARVVRDPHGPPRGKTLGIRSASISSPHDELEFSDPGLERVVDWLVDAASRETGIDLHSDKLAKTRITEKAQIAMQEVRTGGASSINLPYITADASGPKHFNISLDKEILQEILQQKV